MMPVQRKKPRSFPLGNFRRHPILEKHAFEGSETLDLVSANDLYRVLLIEAAPDIGGYGTTRPPQESKLQIPSP